MPTFFYALVMAGLFMAIWVAFQNLYYPVFILDLFLIMFPGLFPSIVVNIIYVVNIMVWTKLLYDLFAPKKAN